MELFEFYKKDGTLNRNEFLNRLIVNYYEIYTQNNETVLESIKEKLSMFLSSENCTSMPVEL